MDLELKGKVAIVTGGSRGIGKAIGRELAKEGANVALVGRDLASLEPAAAELARMGGGQVKGFKGDTGDDASVKKMVADVVAAFGRVDILVNCAAKPSGQTKPPSLAELTTEEFWDHLNTKVVGYMRTAREVAPHMTRQKWGRIINISGLGARQTGTTIGSIRNVSVAALTKNLADELGPSGISVVVRASGPDAHGGDTGGDRAPLQGARHQPRGGREADGSRQRAEASHHGRGDRLRVHVPRLAEGGGGQRRRDWCRRRRSR